MESQSDRPADPSDESAEEPSFPGWPPDDPEIAAVFQRMLQDGSWGRYHGPHCDHLRSQLSDFHDVDHVHLCSSGTAAIELALRAAGVQDGREVILAAYDYKANFANVLAVKAVPVLIDTLPGLPVLDVGQLEAAITDRTAAIIVSHLHGSFGPIHPVLAIAEKYGLTVIEDACQAPGAVLSGRRAGAIGHLGTLSFGGSKLLTAGRGGAVLTRDPQLAQRIRLHTQRGNDAYPLSEMQAAVLAPQLEKLDQRNHIRRKNVHAFLDEFGQHDALASALAPAEASDQPAFYKLALRLPEETGVEDRVAQKRTDLSRAARAAGVALDAAFPALHRIHASRRFRAVGELPHASALHASLMTLHHPLLLQQEATVRQTARTLRTLLD